MPAVSVKPNIYLDTRSSLSRGERAEWRLFETQGRITYDKDSRLVYVDHSLMSVIQACQR